MKKDSSGYDVAKCLQENGGKASLKKISDSLEWGNRGFLGAVIRDMSEHSKTVKIEGDMVFLTDLGVDELAKAELQ